MFSASQLIESRWQNKMGWLECGVGDQIPFVEKTKEYRPVIGIFCCKYGDFFRYRFRIPKYVRAIMRKNIRLLMATANNFGSVAAPESQAGAFGQFTSRSALRRPSPSDLSVQHLRRSQSILRRSHPSDSHAMPATHQRDCHCRNATILAHPRQQ